MKFTAFSFIEYTLLRQQFKAASLDIFLTEWSRVHDFTPQNDKGKLNYSYLPYNTDVCTVIPNISELLQPILSTSNDDKTEKIDSNNDGDSAVSDTHFSTSKVILNTYGTERTKKYNNPVFICVNTSVDSRDHTDEEKDKLVYDIIDEIETHNVTDSDACILIRTRSIQLTKEQYSTLFPTANAANNNMKRYSGVAIEYDVGDNTDIVGMVSNDMDKKIYYVSSSDKGKADIDQIFC
jgi:hypothetical protein